MTTKRLTRLHNTQPAPTLKPGVISDRRAAFLSMDRDKIIAYMEKWRVDPAVLESMKADESVFWGGVHAARVNCMELPKYERDKSRRWLRKSGVNLKDVIK